MSSFLQFFLLKALLHVLVTLTHRTCHNYSLKTFCQVSFTWVSNFLQPTDSVRITENWTVQYECIWMQIQQAEKEYCISLCLNFDFRCFIKTIWKDDVSSFFFPAYSAVHLRKYQEMLRSVFRGLDSISTISFLEKNNLFLLLLVMKSIPLSGWEV